MREGYFILGLVFAVALLMVTFSPTVQSYIPPTPAWFRITSGGANVTAGNSSAIVNFIAGPNMTITPNYLANSITFSSASGGLASNTWSITCNPGDFINVYSNSTHPDFTCMTPSGGSVDYTNIAFTNKTNTFILPQNINHTLNLENPDANTLSEIAGDINFTGRNDSGAVVNYARIETSIGDPAQGAESANFKLQIQDYTGDLFDILRWESVGTYYGNFAGLKIPKSLLIDGFESGFTQDPEINFMRPAQSGVVGGLTSWGYNTNNNTIPYSSIFTEIADPSAGTEAGIVHFQAQNYAGSSQEFMTFDPLNIGGISMPLGYLQISGATDGALDILANSSNTGFSIETIDSTGLTSVITTGTGDNGLQIQSTTGKKLAFHGSTPIAQQTITGNRIDSATADLLSDLDIKGLIDDQSTFKTCADGQFLKYQTSNSTWICGSGSSGITSINADSTAAQVFSGTSGNVTITDTGAGTLQWNLGPDVVMEAGTQTITGTKTMNALTLGGQLNTNGQTILNTGTLTLPTTTGTLIETVEAATFITNGKTFNDNILKIRNPADSQSYSIRSSAITAARDLNLPLTRQTETLAVTPPILDAAPGNPAGTSSTTGVMAGIGSTCTITPQTTGRIYMIVSAEGTTNTGDDGFGFDLRYGTGGAPINGAGLTGTIIHAIVRGQSIGSTSTTDVLIAPITLQGLPTGLALGTAIWIDIGERAVTGGTATFTNVRCTAFEV